MGFHHEDAASRWRRGRPVSTKASYSLRTEIRRPEIRDTARASNSLILLRLELVKT